MVPAVIGVLHFSLGGREAVERLLAEHHGVRLPEGVTWLEDPTPQQVRRLAPERQNQRHAVGDEADTEADDGALRARNLGGLAQVDVVVGTTVERDLLADAGLPWVEMGFPSERHHCLTPSPWIGFSGVLHTLQRVMERLEER